jgi:hypothetical protein
MSTTVNLVQKNGDEIKKIQHEIEDINLLQFQNAMKVIKDIVVEVQKSPELAALVQDLFAGEGGETDELKMDKQFLSNLIGSFDLFLVHLPDQAFKLLSTLSNIELNTLKEQKVLAVFDIYDAVLEENDIEALVERGKKSLAKSKAALAFRVVTARATGALQAGQH